MNARPFKEDNLYVTVVEFQKIKEYKAFGLQYNIYIFIYSNTFIYNTYKVRCWKSNCCHSLVFQRYAFVLKIYVRILKKNLKILHTY